MNGFTRIIGVLLIGCLTAQSFAQAPDTSTPKAAMKAFLDAVARNDGGAVAELLLIENDTKQELNKCYADLMVATKRLADVVKQKYPGVQNDLAKGAISPEDIKKVDSAKIVMKGDSQATVIMAGRSDTVLQRVNGNWRVLAGQGSDVKPGQRDNRKPLLVGLTQAMNQVADEISADKFATVQEADDAVKARLSSIVAKVMQGDAPTSRPTTRP